MVDPPDLLYLLLRPLSPLYGIVMKIRAILYSCSFLKSSTMKVPVISVGNLCMGGTGKTPTVEYITKVLLKKGYSPAIISRGYGGNCKEKVNIVSDGTQLLLNAKEAGDEPRLLAESLPTVPVLTGSSRIFPCRSAIDQFKTDVLILDDGFQHLQVNRDIDLVLFSAPTLTKNMNVFPGGVLRETFSALSRASAIVITGVSDTYQYDIEEFSQRIKRNFPKKPIFLNGYEPQYAQKKGDLTPLPLSQLPPKLFGFCGIASPHRFQNSLQTANIKVLGWKFFRDHSEYSTKLIKSLENNATKIGCTALITTEKDMVKLHSLPSDMPIYSVKMGVTADDNFSSYLNNELSAYAKLHK